MSRPRLLRPMAPDLAALGDQLEAAAHRDVQRRRGRRQLVLNAAASLMVAVPLSIGLATANLGAGSSSNVGAAGARPLLSWTPGYDISLRHIPDQPLPSSASGRCLDGNDCRILPPLPLPRPYAVDFPPRRA